MRLTSPSWAAYALIMGRCCTGYTAISGAMPGMTHSYQTHGLLAAAWGHQSSYGYGLFEAEIPSETMRWIRSLWGAECALDDSVFRKYGGKLELVGTWWSGQHKRVVDGIDGVLLLVVIGDGKLVVPVDFAVRRPNPT